MVKTQKTTQEVEPLCKVEVRSNEEPHVSLGHYRHPERLRGFAIHLSPDPEPDAIVTQVTCLEGEEVCELVLHIANYGDKTVDAEVWRL